VEEGEERANKLGCAEEVLDELVKWVVVFMSMVVLRNIFSLFILNPSIRI
jgi:hypothetical protein